MKKWWCQLAHGSSAVSFGGAKTYECRSCGCTWPVPWAKPIPNPHREDRFREVCAESLEQAQEVR